MKRYRLTLKEQSYDPVGNLLIEDKILDNFLDGVDISDWHIVYTEALLKLKRMKDEKATA